MMKHILLTTTILGLTACNSVTYLNQPLNSLTPVKAQTQNHFVLTQNIAKQLIPLKNEVTVKNILYVTHNIVNIDNKEYAMLHFHTTHNQVYHTRVESNKLTVQHIERLKGLKGVTFIGVLPSTTQAGNYYFKNFKDFTY